MSHMKSITQINCTIESHRVMCGMTSHTRFKIHGSWEFMEIQIAGMGKCAQKLQTYQEGSQTMLFDAPEQLRCL